MRVLIDYRPALKAPTGVGEWVHRLVVALAALDSADEPLDLTIFSSSWKDRLGESAPAEVRRIDRRIPVAALNYGWHRLAWPPIEMVTGAPFDVVHSPHPLLIPSRRAARVVTIHDLDFLDHPDRAEAEIRRDYPRLVTRHARRANHIVVPSRHTATEVTERLGISPEGITVCPNGPPAWAPRTTWPAPGHILFVGAVAPRKNIGVLLDAYAALLSRRPDLPPLVLAGPPSPQADEWMRRIDSPPLAGHVRCTGYLGKDELRRYYDEARLLVLPSLTEGFGLPALEAMTVGVPVVVSRRGALPEVVGDAGLVVEPTPEAIADALERLVTDEGLAHTLAERGRRRAGDFSWTSSAERLVGAYRQALRQR